MQLVKTLVVIAALLLALTAVSDAILCYPVPVKLKLTL